MALIADLVESVKAAFGAYAQGFRTLAEFNVGDLSVIAQAARDAFEQVAETTPVFPGMPTIDELREIFTLSATALGDPKAFITETLNDWSVAYNKALALLNVDSPDAFDNLDFGNPDVAVSALRLQSGKAGQRVAGAAGIINLIVVSANAISVVAEGLSGGTIRSIAEAVQSWVWANGIGGLSGMSYQPQMNASVFPWLNRKFSFAAQAGIPGEGDLVRFQLREVFETQRRAELLEGPERPTFDHYMQERGLNKYWADSFWAAHWVLPSIGQLNEMLFRGVIDRPEWERFVRFNDFDPSSIPRLGEIIFNPYTRVDTRRMADLGVLNEQEQLQAYADLGFFAETRTDSTGRIRAVFKSNPDFTVDKAQALVVFTRLFNALPDLRARFKNGWITQEELFDELLTTGIPRDRAQVQFETIVKAEKEARVQPEKSLTRGLIVRGWKLRLISFDQAIFLLMRTGWDFNESELILRVQSLPDDPLAFVATELGVRLTGVGRPGDVVMPDPDDF